ncbi:RAP domain-containing protein [Mesobacillus subterraneus]|uniref:RAP domain-containing protein n=1 Tax=Mesobacillus subterraneus TaxID=285983 RepID=A0A3R9KWF4_9BACI|nr:RAP domain-containing protein [Mesobacillus subterraneus]RSD27627.1 hypothetical protein EJA10_07540 [Mesobacillus subterraneus]
MEQLERVVAKELEEISREVEKMDVELDNHSEGRTFKAFNYPTKPSLRTRQVIEALHEISRSIGISGPIQEYRVGNSNYWIDICYILDWSPNAKKKKIKYGFEIQDPYHFDEKNFPDQKLKDKRKKKFLEKEGWKVKIIPYDECDQKGPEKIAWEIIAFMMDHDLGLVK